MHQQLEKKFGHRGNEVVEDNYRVIRRGFDEVAELDWQRPRRQDRRGEPAGRARPRPGTWATRRAARTWPTRTASWTRCARSTAQGDDPIADPFAAFSAIPAATGIFRDMTNIRFEVPKLIADRCTGCGQCWTQCPDAAIPGLVVDLEDAVRSAVATSADGNGHQPSERLRGLVAPLAAETRKLLRDGELHRLRRRPHPRLRGGGRPGSVSPARSGRRSTASSTPWRRGPPSCRWPAPPPSSPPPSGARRAAAACSPSPSTPTPARGATCASRSAPTRR